ncbi:MAG TPA: hypothetical protein VMF55_03185 [Solirubrobacterales bacterium]|nr:hypothetical protein [Solirubrobacterales bacterium]
MDRDDRIDGIPLPRRADVDRDRGVRRGAVDRELTGELVEEVLRTALALEDVISGLLRELPTDAFPGEDPGCVLLDMVVGSVHPAATVAGVRDCRSAIALVVAVRERVLADLRAAAELAGDHDRPAPQPPSNPEK